MRPTELDEPASSAAFDRISENSLSVYLFGASLKGEPHSDKEGFEPCEQHCRTAPRGASRTLVRPPGLIPSD